MTGWLSPILLCVSFLLLGRTFWNLYVRGIRTPRTTAVFEALLPSVILQLVTTEQARESYQHLVNAMGEPVMATPAISQGAMIIRTLHHVVAVGEGARRTR